MYTKLLALHEEPDATRSPVVFVQGFPDSHQMFADYFAASERQRPWLAGRSVYAVDLPNRHTNASAFPTLREMAADALFPEVATLLDQVARSSPTGTITPVVHDWGATFTWRYIREGGHDQIDRMVSFSVGSTLRHDVWEHGPGALTWLYALLFGLPWYVPLGPVRRGVAQAIRSPQDRIASTAAFEAALESRPSCQRVVWDDANHWFVEQQSDRVLALVRPFLAPEPS